MPSYLTQDAKRYRFEGGQIDGRSLLPVLEFCVGSLGLSRKQALIELGFPEEMVDTLMENRVTEDLERDPSVIQSLVDHLAEQTRRETFG